jgi:plasmid stabilization system protein ParE
MKPIYSRRALADLDQILAWYSANAGPAMAEAIEQRLDDVVDRTAVRRNQLRVCRSARRFVL